MRLQISILFLILCIFSLVQVANKLNNPRPITQAVITSDSPELGGRIIGQLPDTGSEK